MWNLKKTNRIRNCPRSHPLWQQSQDENLHLPTGNARFSSVSKEPPENLQGEKTLGRRADFTFMGLFHSCRWGPPSQALPLKARKKRITMPRATAQKRTQQPCPVQPETRPGGQLIRRHIGPVHPVLPGQNHPRYSTQSPELSLACQAAHPSS